MPCYRPIDAWRSKECGASGKRKITFDSRRSDNSPKLQLPCGQCVGCRLERSRQWAMRCVHEASLYENNCFITLTYNDEHLPADGSLNKKHFQDFMKRLRRRFCENPIRYYHCGEYGEVCKFCSLSRPVCRCDVFVARPGRPHYHACLFNFDFVDKKLFKVVDGQRLFTSEILGTVWPFGFSTVGSVTFESAAYVARYIMKKVNGDRARDHYFSEPNEDGEVFELLPEYTTMSRRPGLGTGWLNLFGGDVFPDDVVVMRGRKMKPPRFYDSIYEIDEPEDYARLKALRMKEALRRSADNTEERLVERHTVKLAQVSGLKRGLPDET